MDAHTLTEADQAIDLYLETVLTHSLITWGVSDVPGQAMERGLADTRFRLRSVFSHWHDLPMRQALLLIGVEEGTFYEPRSAPLDIRALVVVAIRNSLIEDLGSEGSMLLPKGWSKKYGRLIEDPEMRQLTEQAIRFWQKIPLDQLSPPHVDPEQDLFGAIQLRYPRAWFVWRQLAQTEGVSDVFPEYDAPLPEIPTVSVKPTHMTLAQGNKLRQAHVLLSGSSPEIEPSLVSLLKDIASGQVGHFFADSWKFMTRNSDKLFRIIDFVLAYKASLLTHNYVLAPTWVCKRQPLLRPAHTTNDMIQKFHRKGGLVQQHRLALETIQKRMLEEGSVLP